MTAFEVQNYDLTIQYLSEALTIKPGWEKAMFIRGKAYLELASYNEALDDFHAVVRINPHEAEYLYYKGRSEWRLNRMKIARMSLASRGPEKSIPGISVPKRRNRLLRDYCCRNGE